MFYKKCELLENPFANIDLNKKLQGTEKEERKFRTTCYRKTKYFFFLIDPGVLMKFFDVKINLLL